MLLIEEDPRIEPDTLWKELIVSATVRKSETEKERAEIGNEMCLCLPPAAEIISKTLRCCLRWLG